MTSYDNDIRSAYNNRIPWEMFSGCNILIAGATGAIGSCLIDLLINKPDKDYEIYALGMNCNRAIRLWRKYKNESCLHFIQADVSEELHEDKTFHFIIHAASPSNPSHFVSNPVEVMKSNFYGVSNLIEYGMKHEMKRFLYVSSGEVYGDSGFSVLKETGYGYIDLLKTRSSYPSSKRAAETLAISYGKEYGADIVIARPCHVYGPHFTESDNRAYAQFFRNMMKGESIILKSEGSQQRSWCYVVDCAIAILLILLKGSNGEAYNIADKNSTFTIGEFAKKIADISQQELLMQSASRKDIKEASPISHAVLDSSKLEQLGWHIEGTIDDKLKSTIETLRHHQLHDLTF